MKELEEIEEYAKANNVPIIRPKSRQLLMDLINQVKPKNILEIGTAIGFSGSLMLLNSSSSKLTTIEILPTSVKLAKENFKKLGLESRVNLLQGDATELLTSLANSTQQQFDFIFLDGPKSHYLEQLPYLLTLLKKDGIILADNVLFMGEVLSDIYPKHKHRTIILKLRKFIETVQQNKNLESKIIDLEDGLLLIKKIT